MATLQQLYNTLQERLRPEDVAEMIQATLNDRLDKEEARILERAAQGSLARSLYGYTSMSQHFASVGNAKKPVNKAMELFKLPDSSRPDPEDIEDFIRYVSNYIQKPFGENNFETGRLNKAQREACGMDISKRAYNKRWRLLKKLEYKLLLMAREKRRSNLQKIAKHGLSHQLDFASFGSDEATACFIAYYNATCNLRSEFTIHGQQRPFDEIAAMLLARCKTNTANWWAIAHIYPDQMVLQHLTDTQKGLLLGKWTAVLEDTASLLEEVWAYSNINRETMIVKKGKDSTTWNNAAGAWNKSRDHWIHLIYAMGMEEILDEVCFGKVLRLMAADVAARHCYGGNGLDPNTIVWSQLPLPWEVFRGKADCNRQVVTDACEKAKLHPEQSGWIAPRERKVATFRPTPELVHGVSIGNPFLATVLKKHKIFSGKNKVG